MKGFKDALVAGLEEYYIGIRNGEPVKPRSLVSILKPL